MSETTNLPIDDAPASEEQASAAVPAPQPPRQPDDANKTPPWFQRRLDNVTSARREAETRAERESRERADVQARYDAVLKSLPDDHPARQQPQISAEELQQQAERRGAERALADERERKGVEEFVGRCNGLVEKAQKDLGQDGFKAAADGWFKGGLDLPNPPAGHTGNKAHRDLFQLILDQDDGHRIFADIGKDPGFAAYLLDPTTPPMQAAFAIARRLPAAQAKELIADAQEAAADEGTVTTTLTIEHPPGEAPPAPAASAPSITAPAPRVSTAPRPAAQVPAQRSTTAPARDIYDRDVSMAEFAKQRAEQERARRRR